MKPDLNLLYALDALLEEGSVIGAARKMHLSPSAMSRTLARLRETTGDPIFVQSGRELVPTPHALYLQDLIKESLVSAMTALAHSKEIDLSKLKTRFNIRANDIFISTYAGRLLTLMQENMPLATLCFTPEEDDQDAEALRSGKIDLFISASRPLGHEIKVQNLFKTDAIGVARADHPIFNHEINAQNLIQWGHIAISRRGKSFGPIDEALSKMGLKRQVNMIAPNASTALLSLGQSDLILTLSSQLAHNAVRTGMAIRMFNLPFELPSITIIQAWHPRHQLNPSHQWLRAKIREITS